jgi:hypothetical protein
MLSAPTSLILYVCQICGAYWTAARRAEVTPKNVAHFFVPDGSGDVGDEAGATIRRKKVVNVIRNLRVGKPSEQCGI